MISTICSYQRYCITMSMQIFFFNDNKLLYFSINSGAVESEKKYHCNPLQSLDCKEFSTGYWQWCHLFLLEAVRQFGYPCLLQHHQVNGHFLRSVSILPMLCYLEFLILMKQFDFKMCLYFHGLMLQLFWKS